MSLNITSTSDNSNDSLSVDDIIMDQVEKNRILTPPLLYNKASETCERFESLPNRAAHEKFLREFVDEILSTAVFEDIRRENKVCEWHAPAELMKLFDMSLKATSDTDETLMDLVRKTVRYSVKTGHPYFVNQLFSCVDPYALAGQWLTDALNPSVYTYEVSPVFILMEEVVLREMRSIIGWENGSGDGLFSPGGSISNGYGINCARYKLNPDIKVSIIFIQINRHQTMQFMKFIEKLLLLNFRRRGFKCCLAW